MLKVHPPEFSCEFGNNLSLSKVVVVVFLPKRPVTINNADLQEEEERREFSIVFDPPETVLGVRGRKRRNYYQRTCVNSDGAQSGRGGEDNAWPFLALWLFKGYFPCRSWGNKKKMLNWQ